MMIRSPRISIAPRGTQRLEVGTLPVPARRPDRSSTPRFPGATLAVDASGQITGVWLGAAAPELADTADLLTGGDDDPASPDAALIQLLLAGAVGAPLAAWPVLSGDAPAVLHRRDGRALAVSWDAIGDGDVIGGVALFALAIAVAPDEPSDPAEHGRICSEAMQLLDDCDACLLHLERDPRARGSLHRLFRAMHTLKGAMRGATLRAIRDLAHEAESVIESLRDCDEAPGAIVAELAGLLRELRSAVAAACPPGTLDDAMAALLRETRPAAIDLQMMTMRLAIGDRSADATASRAIEQIRAASARAHMMALVAQCEAAAQALAALTGGASDDGLIDEIAALDRQLDLYAAVYRDAMAQDAGPSLLAAMAAQVNTIADPEQQRIELAALVAQVPLPSIAEALADPDPLVARCAVAVMADAPVMFEPCHPCDETTQRFARAQRELSSALDTLSQNAPGADLTALRAAIARLGDVPLAPTAARLVQMTRSLAAELGKRCEAKVDLGELAVPSALTRVVAEILLHAVRNAIDHGIEAPERRSAAGKAPLGSIEIAGYAIGDRLVVTVRDDGRGVDIERVRALARERGLVSADDAAGATSAELLDLLFHPGFSTAASVTLVSGRGIGMDVIRSLAEEHGGSVAITSAPGAGTELTIELAL